MFHFIVNKTSQSGGASSIWEDMELILRARKVTYEVHFTEHEGHAREIAAQLTAPKPTDQQNIAHQSTYQLNIAHQSTYQQNVNQQSDTDAVDLIVMGGDGTINEVLNGIQDFSKVSFAVIPSGSGNDFCRGLGIKGTPTELLNRIISDKNPKSIDLGRVTYGEGEQDSRIFGVSSGIGVDAYVCTQVDGSNLKKVLNALHMGSATYGLFTVGDIFTMPFANGIVNLDGKEEEVRGIIFAAAMNSAYEGGGIPMAPHAKMDSGHLTAFLAHDIKRAKCFGLLPLLIKGTHAKRPIKGFDLRDFSKLTISMDQKMCVHTDGEVVGFFENVVFECLPGVLKVRGVS